MNRPRFIPKRKPRMNDSAADPSKPRPWEWIDWRLPLPYLLAGVIFVVALLINQNAGIEKQSNGIQQMGRDVAELKASVQAFSGQVAALDRELERTKWRLDLIEKTIGRDGAPAVVIQPNVMRDRGRE